MYFLKNVGDVLLQNRHSQTLQDCVFFVQHNKIKEKINQLSDLSKVDITDSTTIVVIF